MGKQQLGSGSHDRNPPTPLLGLVTGRSIRPAHVREFGRLPIKEGGLMVLTVEGYRSLNNICRSYRVSIFLDIFGSFGS